MARSSNAEMLSWYLKCAMVFEKPQNTEITFSILPAEMLQKKVEKLKK